MRTRGSSRNQAINDHELVAAVVRARGRNRAGATKRDGWEREMWLAYVNDGVPDRASNGPPPGAA